MSKIYEFENQLLLRLPLDIAKDLNYLQKWWIFAKSGHTAPATKFERQEAE